MLGSVFAALADNDAKDAVDDAGRGRHAAPSTTSSAAAAATATSTRASSSPWRGSISTPSRPEDAARVLRRLLDDEPDLPEASVLLARAETALGNPSVPPPRSRRRPAATRGCSRRWPSCTNASSDGPTPRLPTNGSRTLAPGSDDTRIRWATALLQIDSAEAFAKAREVLRPVIAAAPAEPRALYLLSTAERRAKDFVAAEATARALIAAAAGCARVAPSRSRRCSRISACSPRPPTSWGRR